MQKIYNLIAKYSRVYLVLIDSKGNFSPFVLLLISMLINITTKDIILIKIVIFALLYVK